MFCCDLSRPALGPDSLWEVSPCFSFSFFSFWMFMDTLLLLIMGNSRVVSDSYRLKFHDNHSTRVTGVLRGPPTNYLTVAPWTPGSSCSEREAAAASSCFPTWEDRLRALMFASLVDQLESPLVSRVPSGVLRSFGAAWSVEFLSSPLHVFSNHPSGMILGLFAPFFRRRGKCLLFLIYLLFLSSYFSIWDELSFLHHLCLRLSTLPLLPFLHSSLRRWSSLGFRLSIVPFRLVLSRGFYLISESLALQLAEDM